MIRQCSCRFQLIRAASTLSINPSSHETPDLNLVQNAIVDKIYNTIYNTFAENNFVLVRPVGDCDSLKKLTFLALKRIPKKNRLIIKARRKNWVLGELQTLGAFADIIDHVNGYSDDSPEMTLLSQAIFYGSRFDAGRHLLEQLVQFTDLRGSGNQLIRSVYDREFKESNGFFLLKWAALLKGQANLADDAASRANLLANHLIKLGTSNPAWQSSIRAMITANCWNLFGR